MIALLDIEAREEEGMSADDGRQVTPGRRQCFHASTIVYSVHTTYSPDCA